MSLGIYFGWHSLAWEELRELVQRAEELGYAAAFADGDISMLERRAADDCLDGWTVTLALLAATRQIEIGSLRLVHHWNAAKLAQAAATAERLFPGRLRFQISIGDWAIDARFGLPKLDTKDRVAWLDETLEAARALWQGQVVTRHGRFVKLSEARVRPAPPAGRPPVTVMARRPRMLELVAAHADVWDVNLPPMPELVAPAAERLAEACRTRGRDPAGIGRSMLLFCRLDRQGEAARDEYRELNPWFRSIPEAGTGASVIVGDARSCREQIEEARARLGLTLPVVDASGLSAPRARELIEGLAPEHAG
jgi:alkanesulfonate monooxygenase SsuD/methylene tetrahydromethanopterin reductase-like flavin-dependent oxidoreductase (luciferase family)